MSTTTGRTTLVHLSDIHATEGPLLYDRVDSLARIDQVATYLLEVGVTPEAVVVSGDLAQRGQPGAYPALRDALACLADRVGAPVLTVLGNHDDPAAARILPGHEERHYGVARVGALRIVRLDSSSAALGPAQLAWLKDELAHPAVASPDGTVIVLHHAPVPSPLPTLAKGGLRDAEAFGDAIAGTDVRLVLAGHYHHALSAVWCGIPVQVGPSLAYHQIMNAGPSTVAGQDVAMFQLIHLTAEGVTTAPVSLTSRDPLFTLPLPTPTTIGKSE